MSQILAISGRAVSAPQNAKLSFNHQGTKAPRKRGEAPLEFAVTEKSQASGPLTGSARQSRLSVASASPAEAFLPWCLPALVVRNPPTRYFTTKLIIRSAT